MKRFKIIADQNSVAIFPAIVFVAVSLVGMQFSKMKEWEQTVLNIGIKPG
jgi:hypothetical protein